jgi:hypothetical protein
VCGMFEACRSISRTERDVIYKPLICNSCSFFQRHPLFSAAKISVFASVNSANDVDLFLFFMTNGLQR